MRVLPDEAYNDDGQPNAVALRALPIKDLRQVVIEHYVAIAAEHRESVNDPSPCWGLGGDGVGWNVEGGGLPKCSECGKRTAADSVITYGHGDDEVVRCYRCAAVRHLTQCVWVNQGRLPGL